MDSPVGQGVGAAAERGRSPGTRERLLDAAAELIAELGWGRVTTRAIAQRAGLPHGAVSYHFRGKQELLTAAALRAVERLAPMSELGAAGSLTDLLGLIADWVGDQHRLDPAGTGVLLEAMREAGRNPALRQRLAGMLGAYRQVLGEVVDAELRRGAAPAGQQPAALATLIAAVGDGLLLHALLDPDLDTGSAVDALLALLRT